MINGKKNKSFKQESKRIAEKRRKRPFMRRIVNSTIIILFISFCLIGTWLWRSGKIVETYESAINSMLNFTTKFGLELKNVYLTGAKHVSEDQVIEVLSKMGFDSADKVPTFAVSLTDLKHHIEQIGWVKEAVIERQLPDSLHITIIERAPGAVWQYKGKLALVDLDGHIITEIEEKTYPNLPLLVGEDANNHIIDLLAFLKEEPSLIKNVASAIRVGNRRWNIRFVNNVEVKLPEENPDKAWHLLAKLHKDKKLLDRAVKTVDMRVGDRMFIETIPGTDNAAGPGKEQSMQDKRS